MCGFWARDINTLDDLRKREVALGATGGTAKDPEFAADAARSKLHVNPLSGASIVPIIADMMQTPEPVLGRARAIIKGR